MYIKSYGEIEKFFCLLGGLFSFVTSDVHEKVTILRQYNDGDVADYKTIRGMLAYEVTHDITVRKDTTASGARTLLRLHRALLFTIEFIKAMLEVEAKDKLCKSVQNAYANTLSKHHTWLVRGAVNLALYALPTKQGLLDKITAHGGDGTLSVFTEVCKEAQDLYDVVEAWYTEFDLHSLP